MIPKSALREVITVYAAADTGTADRYGNPTRVEASGVQVPAALRPGTATELEIDRDTRISRYTVLVAPDAPVDGLTRIEWRGKSYDVLGEPQEFTTRGNEVHHLEFDVRGVEG